MSEIQVGQINSTDGSTAITTGADGYVSFAKTQIGGRRNIVQNGDMRIIQRGAGPFTTNGDYPIDRFRSLVGGTGAAMSAQQDSDSPAGFNHSFKYTVTSPNTANDGSSRIATTLEGLDIAHLNFGSANAQTVTISFWVKSSVTGTYAFALLNGDNTRSYVTEYSISSASTWEKKTITIAGDTSGTWSTTNTGGVQLRWPFNSRTSWNPSALDQWETGQYMTSPNAVDFIGTNGATFYLTGVQLEVGTVATPFEHISFGESLAACQRYFCKSYNYEIAPGASLSVDNLEGANSTAGGTTGTNRPFWAGGPFPVTMRDAPTVTLYNVDGTTGKITGGSFAKRDGTAVNIGQRSFNVYNNSGATADEDHYCIFTAQSEL